MRAKLSPALMRYVSSSQLSTCGVTGAAGRGATPAPGTGTVIAGVATVGAVPIGRGLSVAETGTTCELGRCRGPAAESAAGESSGERSRVAPGVSESLRDAAADGGIGRKSTALGGEPPGSTPRPAGGGGA